MEGWLGPGLGENGIMRGVMGRLGPGLGENGIVRGVTGRLGPGLGEKGTARGVSTGRLGQVAGANEPVPAAGAIEYARLVDTTSTSSSTTPTSSTTAPATLSITTAALPNAFVGLAYSTTLQAQGGTPPYTWSAPSGLPAGLQLDASSGVISGVPQSLGTPQVAIQVTDSSSPTPQVAGTSLTMNVSPPPPPTAAPTTTTPAPPAPPITNSSCIDALNTEVQRKLAYQPAQTMRVQTPSSVTVVLGTSSLPPVTIGPGTTIVVPISTTCVVEAELSAAPGTFEISPAGYQPMSFLDSSTVTWTWLVTPQVAGKNLKLELDVNSLFQQPGGQAIPGAVRSYTAQIDVTAAATPLSKRASSIFSNPLFDTFIGALIPLAIAAAVAHLHRRRKAAAARAAEPTVGTLEVTFEAAPDQPGGPGHPADPDQPGHPGQSFSVNLPVGFDQVIGRDQAAGIRIPDSSVSPRHARLFHDESGVWVQDLGSTNGTFVNGDRLVGPHHLHDGDQLTFGSATAVFHEVETAG